MPLAQFVRCLLRNKDTRILENFQLETLEPRLLLSADPVGLSVGGDLSSDPHDILQNTNDPESVEALIVSLAPDTSNSSAVYDFATDLPPSLESDLLFRLSPDNSDSVIQAEPLSVYIAQPPLNVIADFSDEDIQALDGDNSVRHELLFIDTRTPDYEELLDDIQSQDGRVVYEIIILDQNRDGIEQISEVLTQYQQIDAVHIVSHGTEGSVQLGSIWLGSDTMANYNESLTQWQSALTPDADLLFYGCNLAATPDGLSLLNSLGQLTGADVAASDDLTGNVDKGGDWELEYRTGNIESEIAFSNSLQQKWSGILDSSNPLWVSTTNDVTAGGQSGTDAWNQGSVVQVADPNLAFEQAGVTDGTFAIAFDGDAFASGVNVSGLHYVSSNIEAGASNFQLLNGDLLLTVTEDTNWSGNSASPDTGFNNNLAVKKGDVVVFRPDTSGNYSTGSFALLLDDPAGGELLGISLIEQDTTVGDASLNAGDFLFITGNRNDDISLYQVTDVGSGNTSGTMSTLIKGSDTNIGIERLNGIDLVEGTTTIGGQTLNSGTILLETRGSSAGSNALLTEKFDVIALDVTTTTLAAGSGNGSATASILFDGSDVAFDSNAEQIDALTLTITSNEAPALTTTPAAPLSYAILDPATVIDPLVTVTDSDSVDLNGGLLTVNISTGGTTNDTLSVLPGGNVTLSTMMMMMTTNVQVSGITIGTIDNANDGTGGNALVINWNGNSTPAAIEEVLQQIAYNNSSGTPDTSTRIVDYVVEDGDGGTSAIAQQTINYTSVVAPTLTMPGIPVTFTENDPLPAIIDASATVADSDSSDFNTGTLTVSLTINGSTSDNLNIRPGGNITLVGSDVLVSGNIIGTVDAINNGTGGNPLVITWGGINATPAAVQEVVRQIAFDNGTENPSSLTRTVSFTLTDGDGGISLNAEQQINVIPVNDPPVLAADTTASVVENTVSVGTYTVSDVDDDNGDSLTYSLSGTDETLFSINSNTGEVSFNTAPDFETPLDAGGDNTYNITINATITDDGIDTLADSQTIAITVTNNNEAPLMAADTTASISENTTTVGTYAGTDVDATDTLTYTLSGPDAGLFSINAATGVLTFTTAPDFEHPGDAGGDNVYNITVTATDDGASLLTSSQNVAITVSNANEETAGTSNFGTVNVVDQIFEPTDILDRGEEETDSPEEDPQTENELKDGNILVNPLATSTLAQEDLLLLPPAPAVEPDSENDVGKSSFKLKPSILAIMKQIQVVPPEWDGMIDHNNDDFAGLLNSSGFSRGLDELRQEVSNENTYTAIAATSTVAASTGLSIGYVAYLLRGGVLLSSVLSSLPAWTFIDPTPVLSSARGNIENEDDESLESMVEAEDDDIKHDNYHDNAVKHNHGVDDDIQT